MSGLVSSLAPLPALLIEPIVRTALVEDLGRAGDITTANVVSPGVRARAVIAARQPGVIAGLDCVAVAFRLIDPEVELAIHREDGSRIAGGDEIATVVGPARGILTAERVALNFLCHLSGIATATAGLVEAVCGHKAKITCTRKTTPGLRVLEDRKSTRLNSSHIQKSRMPSSA